MRHSALLGLSLLYLQAAILPAQLPEIGPPALVADLETDPDRPSSDPANLTAHGGEVYFTTGPEEEASPGDLRPRRLWRVGPWSPPELLIGAEACYREIVSTGSDLHFLPCSATTLLAVQPAHTFILFDLGPSSRFAGLVGELTPAGERLFFGTRGQGQELWVSDGSLAATRRVADLRPGWTDPCVELPCLPGTSYAPRDLTAAGGAVYFVAEVPSSPPLWRSDGLPEGTVPVPAPAEEVASLVPAAGGLVFAARAGDRWELWSTDGTAAGTRRLATLDAEETPGPAQAVGTRAYLLTRRPEAPLRLWTSDGTAAGTRVVASLPGAMPLDGVNATAAAGGRLYLSLSTDALGSELWTSDGTAAGTRPVADLRPGAQGSQPTALTPVGSWLAFAAEDPEGGREPWLTDGTAAGTMRIADVAPGSAGSSPSAFAFATGTLFFDADDGETGRELWSVSLTDVPLGPALPPPADATALLAPEYPGFRFWVRISAAGQVLPTRRELLCIAETACVSGSVPGRSELFLRIVGPKPNGRLWPTLVRSSTSTIDVWIEQASTGILRHYRLDGATPGSSSLDGLFDRQGFPPEG